MKRQSQQLNTPTPQRKLKKQRCVWRQEEIYKLINVWKRRVNDLRNTKKNRHIYGEIADELNGLGMNTLCEEVHIKIQNLSQMYRLVCVLVSIQSCDCWLISNFNFQFCFFQEWETENRSKRWPTVWMDVLQWGAWNTWNGEVRSSGRSRWENQRKMWITSDGRLVWILHGQQLCARLSKR